LRVKAGHPREGGGSYGWVGVSGPQIWTSGTSQGAKGTVFVAAFVGAFVAVQAAGRLRAPLGSTAPSGLVPFVRLDPTLKRLSLPTSFMASHEPGFY